MAPPRGNFLTGVVSNIGTVNFDKGVLSIATTRIMPLHVGKGRTIGKAIRGIIDYVENPQKTDNGKLISSFQCDSRIADAEFLLSKRQYFSKTGRQRGADDSSL